MNIAWLEDLAAQHLAARRVAIAAGAMLALGLMSAGCANSGGGASCDPECPAFYECCDSSSDAVCRDIINDPNNCGGCGTTCPSGICREARCVPGAGGDGGVPRDGMVVTPGDGGPNMCGTSCNLTTNRCCGSTCTPRSTALGADGRSDPSFMACNGCGIACDATRATACSVPGGGAGTPQCMCGVYGQCAAGSVCGLDGAEYACVNLSTDRMNCGEVGNACNDGEDCVGGSCVCGSTGGACGTGESCCGGACLDTSADDANCGACGVACGAGLTCGGGACLCGDRACVAPAMGVLGESCCDNTCVANSDSNCGCGVACDTAGDETCIFSGGGIIPGMGGMGVCCGQEIPLIGGFCTGGGLPGGDGGLPFP